VTVALKRAKVHEGVCLMVQCGQPRSGSRTKR